MSETETGAQATPHAAAHPLAMLTGDEITHCVAVLYAAGRVPRGSLFESIVLHEPDKDVLARWTP
ncbi:MAG TPA: hypothetical protein VN636_16960, partial [Acidimicrobiia bacterium]|nr:hypothetical protein [Acidimicrobiia bacterium]